MLESFTRNYIFILFICYFNFIDYIDSYELCFLEQTRLQHSNEKTTPSYNKRKNAISKKPVDSTDWYK